MTFHSINVSNFSAVTLRHHKIMNPHRRFRVSWLDFKRHFRFNAQPHIFKSWQNGRQPDRRAFLVNFQADFITDACFAFIQIKSQRALQCLFNLIKIKDRLTRFIVFTIPNRKCVTIFHDQHTDRILILMTICQHRIM